MRKLIISVITTFVFCVGSDVCEGDTGNVNKAAEVRESSRWQLEEAPQEVQAIGKILKEWFDAYLADEPGRARQTAEQARPGRAGFAAVKAALRGGAAVAIFADGDYGRRLRSKGCIGQDRDTPGGADRRCDIDSTPSKDRGTMGNIVLVGGCATSGA